MKQQQRIAIIGGGLAGLATAHALKTFGIKAEVYETAPELGEIGAAVNTSPNANKALIAIGVGDDIAKVANSSPGHYTRNMQTGEFLEFRDRREVSKKYSAPYYTFHRADLLDALAKGLDRANVYLGHRLTGLEEHGDTTTLIFANGVKAEADLVIAADGIRSVVRQALYGDDNPSYTGQMVWRALLKGSDVPAEVLEPTGHIQWVGPGCHLLAYYIRGTDLVNIVTQEDTDQWVEEGWSTRGDPDEMRRSFPNPEPRLEKLLSLVTDRRCGACDAAQCRAGRLHGVRRFVYPCALACRGRRSDRSLPPVPPRPHPARSCGAAAIDGECEVQAHARHRTAA
jgi:salicylate hydroxylase